MALKELDVIALEINLREYGLAKDDLGTVVFVHDNGAAYEVEFVDLGGNTIAVITLPANALRAVDESSVLAVRRREPAYG